MSAQPLSDAYRVPGTEPVVAEPEEKEEEVVAAAAPGMTLDDYLRQNRATPALLREVQARVPYQVNPNLSQDEAYAILYPD
jgi:hypothetical protein